MQAVLTVAAQVLAAAAPTPSPAPGAALDPALDLGSEAWWATFLTSPALAGIAAFLAAVGAYLGIRRQTTTTVAIADENRAADLLKFTEARQAQRDDAMELRQQELNDSRVTHWWAMYQWSIDHLDELLKDIGTGHDLLRALALQAPGKAERKLVLVAIDMLLARGGTTP